MTEIEARGKIKYRIANEMRKAGENKEEYEDLEIALQVMKEIREYRELGTVEEVKMLKDFKELYDAYNLIGTIEEFRKLKYKKNVLPIATIEFSKEDMQKIVDEKVAQIELDIQEIRNKAIDDYMNELCNKCLDIKNECYQLECPFCDDGCNIVNIAEQMKGGATDARNTV